MHSTASAHTDDVDLTKARETIFEIMGICSRSVEVINMRSYRKEVFVWTRCSYSYAGMSLCNNTFVPASWKDEVKFMLVPAFRGEQVKKVAVRRDPARSTIGRTLFFTNA